MDLLDGMTTPFILPPFHQRWGGGKKKKKTNKFKWTSFITVQLMAFSIGYFRALSQPFVKEKI